VQTGPAANNDRAVEAKIGPRAIPGETQGALLERNLTSGPVRTPSLPAPPAPHDAVITLEDHLRTAVIELSNDFTVDEYYLQLVSLTPVDNGSAGHEGRLAVGVVGEAPGETRDGASLELALSAAQVTGIALTAGTVWWALRVSGLLTSLMASMPAWRHVDLLPILRDEEEEEVDWGNEDAEAARDEEAVDRVLDASGRGDQR
jgi:hypothetical protein